MDINHFQDQPDTLSICEVKTSFIGFLGDVDWLSDPCPRNQEMKEINEEFLDLNIWLR